MPLYADIVLPVPLNQLFTYLVPEPLEHIAVPGVRVYVPFGKGRTLTGIISKTHHNVPSGISVKEISEILDNGLPTILPDQHKLLEWISQYYLCSPGDVLKASVPAGLRPDSGTNSKPYKPQTEVFIKPGVNFPNTLPINTDELFKKSASAQKRVFEEYLTLSGYHENPATPTPVTKRLLAEKSKSYSALQAIVKSGVLELYELEVGRLPQFISHKIAPAPLSTAQQKAIDDIKLSFESKNVCLLHGVTSSGKTEIYIHLIKEHIEKGGQVLYLLPEIALTTQIMHRLQIVFGDEMCVYHSRCSDNIRAEVWNRLTGPNPYKLILGARSAVMLPFQHLSLVIVDEEHEPSYKQEDPAPRYHGRNTAIMLGAISGAKTLLGSATPSLESYANAMGGKYGLVTLSERFRNIQLPCIEIVDTYELKRKKRMTGLFSPRLIEEINHALENGKQTILFHNRRGYVSKVECPDCGWVQKCDCCDVTLTFHKSTDRASCHYCGKQYVVPHICPSCGSNGLKGRGFGTERIEEIVGKLFKNARVARLDFDSVKSGYEAIITDFSEGRTDILIGTQMISKGLDFDNVSVVGILQADSIMSYPDFRATERAFQLMVQVSGRAGRKNGRGIVIIQSKQPDATVLDMVRTNDYQGFYNLQMEERHAFHYPPYTKLISITAKSQNMDMADRCSYALSRNLTELFGVENILGPYAPPISRVQYLHLRRIMIKASLGQSSTSIRLKIEQAVERVKAENLLNGVTLFYDADPQ